MVLPLPRIAMEILILLVERRGDLVTRQEIAARVWPGSDPEDVFQSINTAINRIRSTLRDEAASPKYVQTVIGKGYRFMAAVEEEEKELASPIPRQAQATVNSGQSVAVQAGSASSSIHATTLVTAEQSRLEAELPSVYRNEWTETPIRRSGINNGWQWAAVLLLLSFGAFVVWRRFAAAANEHRGAFQLAQLTTNGADEPVTAAAISPDGKSLAYADRHGLLLRELGGAVRSLVAPDLVEVRRIEWFPDGNHILVSAKASSTLKPQIWSVSTGHDAPRLVRDGAQLGIPSPDGSRIAYTTTDDLAVTTFWTSDASGANATRVRMREDGESYTALLWSADSRKLIVDEVSAPSRTARTDTANQVEERVAHRLVVFDIDKHTETAALDGIQMDAACLWGKRGVLFAGSANGSPYKGLWRMDLDQETGAPLAAPVQLQLVENVLSLSRSADEREVAAVFRKRQPDVYVATLAQPGPGLTNVKRITFNPAQEYPHAWTPDSKSVLFEAADSVKMGSTVHIYLQALDGPSGRERLVSDPMLQVLPQQSPDGKWILFASKSRWLSGDPYALYRVAEAGGTPVKVDIGGSPLDEYRCPLFGTSCILRETEGHTAFHYYALDPVAGKGRLLCSTAWKKSLLWDWNVSPDGTQVALPVLDPAGPRIRVVPCAGGKTERGEREVPVKITQALMEVTWAADGQGWFVSASAVPQGADLFYVRQDGSATFLRHDNPLWAVPSPDGKKLAFVGETVDSNVWLLR